MSFNSPTTAACPVSARHSSGATGSSIPSDLLNPQFLMNLRTVTRGCLELAVKLLRWRSTTGLDEPSTNRPPKDNFVINMTTTSFYRWLTELWAESFLRLDRAALEVNLPSPPDRRRPRRATISAPHPDEGAPGWSPETLAPPVLPFPDRRDPNRPDRRAVPGPGRRRTDHKPRGALVSVSGMLPAVGSAP